MMIGDRVRLIRMRVFESVGGSRPLGAGERGDVEEVARDGDVYVNFDCGGGSWCPVIDLEEID